MSYLLKALEKAQKEREATSDNKVEYVERTTSASLPKWLVFSILLVLVITILQVLGLLDWNASSENTQVESAPKVSMLLEKSTTQQANQSSAESKQKSDEKTQSNKTYTLMELTPSQLSLLPSIELQSHIYSPRSEMRSVIINDQNFKEGDLLSANVGLKEITQKGIVLKVGQINVYLDKGITWVAK